MTARTILQLRLPAVPGTLALSRNGVAAVLAPLVSEGRMREEDAESAELLVTELVSNSLEHAGLGPADLVLISVTMLRDRVRVEVQDPGSGFHRVDARMPGMDATSGRGIPMMDAMASRWGTERSVLMRVWFELPLAPAWRTAQVADRVGLAA